MDDYETLPPVLDGEWVLLPVRPPGTEQEVWNAQVNFQTLQGYAPTRVFGRPAELAIASHRAYVNQQALVPDQWHNMTLGGMPLVVRDCPLSVAGPEQVRPFVEIYSLADERPARGAFCRAIAHFENCYQARPTRLYISQLKWARLMHYIYDRSGYDPDDFGMANLLTMVSQQVRLFGLAVLSDNERPTRVSNDDWILRKDIPPGAYASAPPPHPVQSTLLGERSRVVVLD